MATKGAIAAGKEQAINRLAASMAVLSERLGVEPADILKRHRDPAYAQLMQLEALADWSEQLVQALDKLAEASGEEQPPAEGEQPEAATTEVEASPAEAPADVEQPEITAELPTDEPKSKRKGTKA